MSDPTLEKPDNSDDSNKIQKNMRLEEPHLDILRQNQDISDAIATILSSKNSATLQSRPDVAHALAEITRIANNARQQGIIDAHLATFGLFGLNTQYFFTRVGYELGFDGLGDNHPEIKQAFVALNSYKIFFFATVFSDERISFIENAYSDQISNIADLFVNSTSEQIAKFKRTQKEMIQSPQEFNVSKKTYETSHPGVRYTNPQVKKVELSTVYAVSHFFAILAVTAYDLMIEKTSINPEHLSLDAFINDPEFNYKLKLSKTVTLSEEAQKWIDVVSVFVNIGPNMALFAYGLQHGLDYYNDQFKIRPVNTARNESMKQDFNRLTSRCGIIGLTANQIDRLDGLLTKYQSKYPNSKDNNSD